MKQVYVNFIIFQSSCSSVLIVSVHFVPFCSQRGVNCGVVEWVDRPWPIIMQRCLLKLWGMLHESNDDRQAKNEEISRLKMDIEQVNLKLENLVAAVERSNVTTMKIDRQKKQMGIVDKDVKLIQRSPTSAILIVVLAVIQLELLQG